MIGLHPLIAHQKTVLAPPNNRRLTLALLLIFFLSGIPWARAQIDPVRRRVLQAGYALPLSEDGPLAAYGFYYHNEPGFLRTNLTLRTAIAPVYLDSELGINGALGPHTDMAVGLAGGGFADTYSELRRGNYLTAESFTGHALDLNSSIYHLFNPSQRMPLYSILRGSVHRSFFERDEDTDRDFEIPDDRTSVNVRAGLRLGGREPYLTPSLAGEVSVWYEGQARLETDRYGYNNDRGVEPYSHLFWARALLAYTFEESKQYMEFSLMAGTSINADRFSAYRLGGSLPLIAEFPLTMPGYHRQELSADQYVQFSGTYVCPIDAAKRWAFTGYGAVAVVDYLEGLSQPGHFHAGIGGGVSYRSRSNAWQLGLAYAYGIEAMREHGRGAHTITAVLQYDLDAVARSGHEPFWDPLLSADMWRGFLGIFTGR